MKGLAVRILPYVLAFFSSFCIMILELVASRLVARHVGASLSVWTSVIGIMLGGICLGNVLGGRLADRVQAIKAVGPLYALGAALTLGCLWMNAVVGLIPGVEGMIGDVPRMYYNIIHVLIGLVAIGCYVLVVTHMLSHRETGAVLISILGLFALGAGVIYAFIYGWIKAGEWRMKNLMIIWSAMIVLNLGIASMQMDPWNVRTVVVVTLDFLVPATVLGMIGPVVAKVAVTQARRAGSAIGDVYFMGAVGSIVGTFVAGFILMYLAPVSTIVTLVAAALAVVAGLMLGGLPALAIGVLAALLLSIGALLDILRTFGDSSPIVTALLQMIAWSQPGQGLLVGSARIHPVALGGHLLTALLAVVGLLRLRALAIAGRGPEADELVAGIDAGPAKDQPVAEVVNADWSPSPPRIRLADLAVLSFVASMSFMALEMVAGRLVQRHLGSSIFGWTSVIGVLLGGLSLGNFLGGKIADFVHKEQDASWLFLVASMLTLSILVMESPANLKYVGFGVGVLPLICYCLVMDKMFRNGRSEAGWACVIGLCALGLGAILAVLKYRGFPPLLGTLSAISLSVAGLIALFAFVYGWIQFERFQTRTIMIVWSAMIVLSVVVGYIVYRSSQYLEGDSNSILSQAITLTRVKLPFSKIEMPMDWWERVLLVTTVVFLLPSISMGTVSPVVAKLAIERVRRASLTGRAIGQVYAWGMVGSILGTFLAGFVLIDVLGCKGLLLVLGLALAVAATALGSIWHAGWAGIPLGLCVLAFVPNPRFEKLGTSWGLREEAFSPAIESEGKAWIDESDYYYIKVDNDPDPDGLKRTLVLDNLIHGYFILGHPERLDYDYEHIYALVTKRVADAKAKAKAKPQPDTGTDADGSSPAPAPAPLSTLFLGGGAYTYQRYMQHTYPGTSVDVAEIDPAVTRANHKALGLPLDTTIKTTWGDARQFVEKNQNSKQYDLIYGDAFNDFSVPWHLTTQEFNDKLAKMLSPTGAYMINIIDAYESDETAREKALTEIKDKKITDAAADVRIKYEKRLKARRYGGFLGAWVETAKKTFPHVAIFGTDDSPGGGLRETFVVVVSKSPIKMDDLGSRDDDPRFFSEGDDRLFEPKPFNEDDCMEILRRSRGIILTDDYAPVENLLAPVAATRGED